MVTTFVGFLLPNNSFLKYVNVLLGLIIMVSIAGPLIGVINNDFSVDGLEWISIDPYQGQKTIPSNGSLKEVNEVILLRKYKSNIDTAIAEQLRDFSPLEILKVSSFVVEDVSNRDFGTLTGVEIILSQKSSSGDRLEPIERIVIGDKPVKINSNYRGSADAYEEKRILEYIMTQFGLSEEKIHLRWEG